MDVENASTTAPPAATETPAEEPKKKPRRFVGKKKASQGANPTDEKTAITPKKGSIRARRVLNQIPDDILNDPLLQACVAQLPSNYNFEIYKTVWRVRRDNFKRVALQMPEGLLVYACLISDILEKFANCETVLMGDVTYGACCVDDFTAKALQCDFLVHYGHSCLVPIDTTSIAVMYVFVDIGIDTKHFTDTVTHNIPKDQKIILVGTIQFATSLHSAAAVLQAAGHDVVVPQSRPLSKGEILGCTSPKLTGEGDVLIYLGDGRFHLESIMISNPQLSAYRYDPYSKVFTTEKYDFDQMVEVRADAVNRAKGAKKFGLVLGTLGRQGSPHILAHIEDLLRAAGKEYVIVLLSEIFPQKLAQFSDVEAWIQIACPRLSIDWGYAFEKPLLNPYEAETVLGDREYSKTSYPMDFYAKDGGAWSVHGAKAEAKARCQGGSCGNRVGCACK